MKTTRALLLGAVAAAVLTAGQTVRAADFSPSDLSNRAIAASPRAKEQFPWLTRQTPQRTQTSVHSGGVVSTIKKNRALAASPRMIEQFPELARTGQVKSTDSDNATIGNSVVAKVLKNRALAASPRMLEQFPELARGRASAATAKSIEVAPLK
jgi:hypothetical protein